MTYPRTPPPDLQTLIKDHGGYDRIPPEAWEAFERDMEEWRLDSIASADWHLRQASKGKQP
jgi:hypothetical protein